MTPIKFEVFNSFRKLRKNMGIVKTKEDVLLKHPNVINYLDRYSKIENGYKIFNEEAIDNIYNYLKINSDGSLVDKITNQHMVLYMYIQLLEHPYKFHISHCTAVEEHKYKAKKWTAFKKYNDDNLFEVKCNGTVLKRKMNVCRYCLERLNYKNYNYVTKEEQESIVENFSLSEYYKEYESSFMYIPDYLKREYQDFNEEYATSYTDDWKETSRRFREEKHWICDKCGKDMSNDKYNLHVHHRDHNKQNNSSANLMCLCRDCHAKMPGHSHMNR